MTGFFFLFDADDQKNVQMTDFEIEDEKTLKMIAKQFHNRYNRMEL